MSFCLFDRGVRALCMMSLLVHPRPDTLHSLFRHFPVTISCIAWHFELNCEHGRTNLSHVLSLNLGSHGRGTENFCALCCDDARFRSELVTKKVDGLNRANDGNSRDGSQPTREREIARVLFRGSHWNRRLVWKCCIISRARLSALPCKHGRQASRLRCCLAVR